MTAPTRPPFDAELAPMLDAIRQALPSFTPESLPEQRKLLEEGLPGMPKPDFTAGGAVTVQERTVPGPVGEPDVSVVILSPASGTGPWPCIFHIHGGGMIVGTALTGLDGFVPFAADGRAVVVSVEYRLAPEHPDPAPVEDCYAALRWTADNAEDLGIDSSRFLIAGASAGGGLAAGVALLARDRAYPDLTHQVLICPMLDDRFTTPSSQMLEDEGIWDRNDNTFGWDALLGDRRGGAEVSYYAAPARCQDLSGLPTTYLDVGSVETFRDEIIDYAQRLSLAGVPVDFHMWGGGFHGFDGMAPQAAISQVSIATRNEFIDRALIS